MGQQSDTGIRQLKNGNWAYRFCISVKGQTISKRGSTDAMGNPLTSKKDAINARAAAILFEQDATFRTLTEKPVARTVRDIFEEYCAKGRSDRAYATIKKQDSLWRNYLCKQFGNRPVGEVSVAEIQDYLSSLYYERGFAYRYVESFLKMFYLIFGQAYSRNYLAVNTYNKLCVNKDTKIRMPKIKTDEDMDIIIFTKDECKALDSYFEGTNAETAYMLGRYCGLRINECYGLKWEQVDLEHGTIRIEQQMQYQEGLIKLVPLKTKNARRTIYLCPKIKDFLALRMNERAKLSDEMRRQREQNQTFIIDTDGTKLSSLMLVNTLVNGRIQTINSMKYHAQVIKEKLHIDYKYHYLRHTYGTHLAVLNTPTHILCNQMGHGNIHVTERYYITMSQDGITALTNNLELL